MSRTLKFRVWDIPNQCWSDLFHVVTEDGALWHFPNNGLAERDDPEQYTVERYTGLKDKYGEEIYEGDVVALMYGYIPVKAYEKDQIKIASAQKAVVRYDDKKAAFRYTIINQDKDCQFKFRTNESMVVIGTIHEDPGLLGGEE